jgi:hypothetical protein
MKKYPHRVQALSGRNGSSRWRVDFHKLLSCPYGIAGFSIALMFFVLPTSANFSQGRLDFASIQKLTLRHWKVRSSKTQRLVVQRLTRFLEAKMLVFPVERSHADLAALIVRLCAKYEIDPVLVLSMIQHESDFNPNAVSPMGARGLMQLMPGTAQFVVERLLDARTREGILMAGGISPQTLEDPFLNITLGVAYLHYLRERYEGNLPRFLAAYNAGPGAVDIRLGQDLGPLFERWTAVYPYIQAVSGSLNSMRDALDPVSPDLGLTRVKTTL